LIRKSVIASILLIQCFFGLQFFAQKTKVYGWVTDAATGDTLPFVNVMFIDSKIGTTTDIEGKYVLESYYATDSILISFVGYKRFTAKVQKDKEQRLDVKLVSSTTELVEFVVKPSDENPAHPIIRNVVKNKEINNREKLDYFEYEVYNKIELDINNLTEEFTDSKAFKKFDFIFDNIDTVSSSKKFLPIFITESLSDFYYQKKPKTEKEFIKATKVSGIENESVAQFTGDMYQKVNIYDNFLPVFGKNFVSPISDRGFGYYRYYLIDSMYIDKYWCYEIQFTPKRKGELTVEGTMWINDTTYAIKKVEGTIAKDANINFVNELVVTQTFEQVENEVWMLVKDELLVDFEVAEKQMGFYGRKLTSYSNFAINKPKEESFYSGIENIILAEDAQDKSNEFWLEHRHDPLTKSQQGIYTMVDTLGSVPIVKTYVDVIQTIASGYYVWGKVELGPYSSIWSYNVVEGNRFRFGMRTSNDFSKMIEFSGYAAYGLRDKQIKYGAATRFFITKKPRRMVHLVYKNDVEQVGISSNSFNSSSAVSFLRRNPLDKLIFNEEYRGSFTREWFQGFSSVILLRNAQFRPIGVTTFNRINSDQTISALNRLSVSEVGFFTRFAYNEEFLAGEFDRISLGTKYPTLSVNYTYGIPNVLGSEYEYHKVVFNFQHKIPMGILGTMRYNFEVGKVFGSAPYPLLEVHNGNETWGYSESAFNMMNILEFVSDEYISFKVRQHFDGLFLNKFPLIRKLKWREVVTLTGVYGRLSDANRALMVLPSFTSTLQAKPYLELAAGIENIFKFLRFDVLWRMTYLDNEYDGIKVSPIGFRMKFQFNF
jgi:hypothetical protein